MLETKNIIDKLSHSLGLKGQMNQMKISISHATSMFMLTYIKPINSGNLKITFDSFHEIFFKILTIFFYTLTNIKKKEFNSD